MIIDYDHNPNIDGEKRLQSLKESVQRALGCWIVLTERGDWNGETCPIIELKAFKVDGEKIKTDTFYQLINGEAVEVE